MKTYQDYTRNTNKEEFIRDAIADYKSSSDYRWAVDGDNYSSGENTEIINYRNFLYTALGEKVEDHISPNNKIASDFFGVFVRQRAAYCLGNGVEFENDSTKEKLGKTFDHDTYFAGQDSLAQGVVYGYWNLDHVEYFKATEIVPIFDEETGLLRVAIRFWQLAEGKPMRITLFEEDGITEYREQRASERTSSKSGLVIIKDKRPYTLTGSVTEADGLQYNGGENYTTLPIIPWYPNRKKKSYLVPLKSKIDAYDRNFSGLVNDSEDNFYYWVFKNQGGLNDAVTLEKMIETIRATHAIVVDETDEAIPHAAEPPITARLETRTATREELYRDAMALDTDVLKAGSVTATQINAAYEPLDEAADEFEYCTIQYILSLLELLGIDDYPKFTRSKERNKSEETDMVLSCQSLLPRDTVIDNLPFLTPEEKEKAKSEAAAEEQKRFDEADKIVDKELEDEING